MAATPEPEKRVHVEALSFAGGYGSSAADESSPVVANGVAYVAGFDGALSAFSAAGCGAPACDPLWQGRTEGDITGAPAVAGDEVLVASADHFLYAFPAAGCGAFNCPPAWKGDLGAPSILSSVVVANGRAYVGTFDDRLVVFAANGCGSAVCRPLWTGRGNGHLIGSAGVAL